MTLPKRKLPKQKRSKKRYAHILETAAKLFEQEGIDTISTNHIADKAEVSIGSLYQFFPNKEAIIEALIENYITDLGAMFPTEIDTNQSLETTIRQVLTNVMIFEREKKGFNEILLNANSDLANTMHNHLVNSIQMILAQYFTTLSPEKSHLCAEISLQMVKGMMGIEGIPSEALLEQMIIALTAYQKAFVESS